MPIPELKMQQDNPECVHTKGMRVVGLFIAWIVSLACFAGCQQPFGTAGRQLSGSIFSRGDDFSTLRNKADVEMQVASKRQALEHRFASLENEFNPGDQEPRTNRVTKNTSFAAVTPQENQFQPSNHDQTVVRGQDFGYGSGSRPNAFQGGDNQAPPALNAPRDSNYPAGTTNTQEPAVIPGSIIPGAADLGSPNEPQPYEAGGNAAFPLNYADLDVYVTETRTGRVNVGGAYNSDNGLVAQFILNESNFDLFRLPKSFRDIVDGTAWRGAGQQFRLELVPGADLERYLVSFSEPYVFGTDYSFNMSAYLFTRQYFDWDEERAGGRFSIGRRLTPDLSITAGLKLESVEIKDPRVDTSSQLNAALGTSNLFVYNVGLVRDTRDNRFQPTEGSYLSLGYSQAFGDFSFARADIDYRRYRLLKERPDGSGRHTLSFGTKFGVSGSSTPIFENYFAGGFSTLRGFDFRGAAPLDGGARVGGRFQWLNTIEYMFPITPDDMIKGVVFCDYGTVEQDVELNADSFRVAPGFGFRIHMPGGGIGAPLAFDFAFPVSTADGDEEQVFSFYLGVLR
ncbi:MAG: BamA/TamA family outer membrane protein [Planctomycetota bacterium]